jgi:hypothetical protein
MVMMKPPCVHYRSAGAYDRGRLSRTEWQFEWQMAANGCSSGLSRAAVS